LRFSLGALLSAEAQSPAKVPKIGFLGASPASRPWHESFLREFRKLGYVDGKSATFIYRFADMNYDRLPALADELVGLKVDVIITPGSNDTRAAKNATRTIPIVFLGEGPILLPSGWLKVWPGLEATSRGSAV
jgi:putative ABC transport system substrate-binding protein